MDVRFTQTTDAFYVLFHEAGGAGWGCGDFCAGSCVGGGCGEFVLLAVEGGQDLVWHVDGAVGTFFVLRLMMSCWIEMCFVGFSRFGTCDVVESHAIYF